MLTTPPGTSLVASTSARLIADSGCRSLAITTTVLPATSAGRDRLHETEQAALPLRRDDRDDAGRLGHREVEVRPGDRVAGSRDLHVLVGPARVPDPGVDGLVDLAAGDGGA